MSLTWHREAYQDYCACCANYRSLIRYPMGEYYCRTCTSKINRALCKKGIDPTKIAQCSEEERRDIGNAIVAIVSTIEIVQPKNKVTFRAVRDKWKKVKRS